MTADPYDPAFAGNITSNMRRSSPSNRTARDDHKAKQKNDEMDYIEETLENQVDNGENLDKELVQEYVQHKLENTK